MKTDRDYLIELVNESLKTNIGKSCDLAKNIVNDIYNHITVKSDISKLNLSGLVEYRGVVGRIMSMKEVYNYPIISIEGEEKYQSYYEIELQVKGTPTKWYTFCCDLSEIKEVRE